MTAADPEPLPALVQEYLGLSFPNPSSDRPHLIVNMIASADGKAVSGATESALSSPTDKLVLQSLRVHADAILNGAGTARASGVNPRIRDPRLRQHRQELGKDVTPLQVLLTRTGSLPPAAPFLRRARMPLVIFAAHPAASVALEPVRAMGRTVEMITPGSAGIAEMLWRLRTAYGVRLLLVEGGPGLNASLFHAGVVDEFFLTLSPRIVGGRDTITAVEGEVFPSHAMPALDLQSARPDADTSEVYLHWRVRRPGESSR